MNQAPAFTMRNRAVAHTSTIMVALPEYVRQTGPNQSLNTTKWERIMVMLKDPSDTAAIKKLTDQVKKGLAPEVLDTIKIINYFQDDKTNDQVKNILDVIFNIIIAITMFLCFFSLCSSMSANLMDQTKEIGIMRAMGFTKSRIKILYFYEAFILVSSSCMLGVMIGVIVGFTMVLQQVVFTGIPLIFYFPWTQFIVIMIISMFCAAFSTWGPAGNLVKNDIATIFRSV
jgi:ABC-type antimicrobial peptide transport system permease subunit